MSSTPACARRRARPLARGSLGSLAGAAFTRGAFTRGAFTRGAFTRGAFTRGAFTRGAFTRGALALAALGALALAGAASGCLERRGEGGGHLILIIPAGPSADGGPPPADGGLPAPTLERLLLRVEGPGLPSQTTALTPGQTRFELELPAGPQRTLSLLGQQRLAGPLVTSWYGATTVDLQAGQPREVLITMTPAGTLRGALWAAGQRVPARVRLRVEAASPRPGSPATLLTETDLLGAFELVVPTGSYAIALDDAAVLAVRDLFQPPSKAHAQVTQGVTLETPIELLPRAALQAPAALLLELVGGTLAGLPKALPADLIVRVVDATGAPTALHGTVTFQASDLARVTVPPDLLFDGQSEQRIAGGVLAKIGTGLALLRAQVREQPAVAGSLAINVLDSGVVPGVVRALRIDVAVQKLLTGILAPAVDLRITALDAAGLVASDYRGTITFVDSDILALLVPADYAFVASDHGTHLFAGGLRAIGLAGLSAVLRVRDRADASIAGQQTLPLVLP